MFEKNSLKRQRDDDEIEDDYEPHNNELSTLPPHLAADYNYPPHQENIELSNELEIPPHEQHGVQSESTNYGDNNNNNNNNNQNNNYYSYNPRKRPRRLQLTNTKIQRAHELCNTLQVLGDSTFEPKILAQCSETMSYFWSDSDFSSNLLKFLGATIVEMPHKSILFSGLIMLSNSKNEQIGKDLIEWLKNRIEEVFKLMEKNNNNDDDDDAEMEIYIDDDEEMKFEKSWGRIISIIRMLCLIIEIIEDYDYLIKLMKDLLEFSINLQSNKDDKSKLADLIFYEITISIPYLVINNSDNEELKEKCKELIEISKKYEVKENNKIEEKILKPIQEGNNISVVSYNEILKNVCKSTESYLNDKNTDLFFDIESIVNPLIKTVLTEKEIRNAKERGEEIEPNDIDLKNLNMFKHSIGEIKVPNFEILKKFDNLNEFVSRSNKLWRHPRFFINIFSQFESRKSLGFETTPNSLSYISMILNDLIIELLCNLEYNRVTLSKQFINFQRFFNNKLFSKSNSPLDKLMIINDLNKGLDFDLIKNLENSNDFEDHIKNQMINSAKKIQNEFEEGFKSTIKMEEIILENIINFIFLLEFNELPIIYFESLLTDTCGRDWILNKRNNQNNSNESLLYSKLIGDCFRYFYNNIEKIEFENLIKFINWFIFQISNFKFEWTWEEWISDVIQIGEDKIYHPKIFFIKNAIHKELLITNFKYIRNKTLPKDFKKIANLSLKNKEKLIKYDFKFFGIEFSNKFSINPFDEIEDEENNELNDNKIDNIIETNTDTYKLFVNYLFNHDEHPYNDLCRDIYMNLENVEESIESFVELIKQLKYRIENDNDNDKNIIKNSDEYIITLIIQSICLIGSRSFSVFEESLNKVFGDKVKSVIEEINNNQREEWIINAVLRIWNNEPRIGLMFIDKLYKFGIINYDSIINKLWRLNDDDEEEEEEDINILPLSEIYADEFLNNLINYIDESDGEEELNKQKDMIKIYFNNCIRKINQISNKLIREKEENGSNEDLNQGLINYLQGLTEDNTIEIEWCLKNLIGLIVSKIRNYQGQLNIDKDDIRDLVKTSVENSEIQVMLLDVVSSM